MAETKVSSRYANSLLDMSSEKNNLDEISIDMELVHSAIRSSKELKNILDSPIVKSEIKKSVLSEIFKNKISNDSLGFIKFVIDKNREDILDSIIEKFLELRDEKLGLVRVEVRTSFDFTDEQKEKLRKRLESILNKKAHLKFIVDNTIVGGFIAKVGDTVYDASIKHQLELLRKEFLHGSVQLN
jgi:F-type H+-transporting ATPase subunit delta